VIWHPGGCRAARNAGLRQARVRLKWAMSASIRAFRSCLDLSELVRNGHIYLAQPPLYRLTQGARSIYAMDDADKDQKLRRAFKTGSKVEVSRFKGLGEMPPVQLKETTMDPARRTLLKVVAVAEERAATNELVESLMGRRPELRFAFIQERAKTVEEVDV
jgi:topoisomerase IV subunit B